MLASSQLGFRSNRKAVQIVFAQGCKGVGVGAQDSGEGVPRDAAECVPKDSEECVSMVAVECVPRDAREYEYRDADKFCFHGRRTVCQGMQKRARVVRNLNAEGRLKVKQGQPCNMPQSRLSILS